MKDSVEVGTNSSKTITSANFTSAISCEPDLDDPGGSKPRFVQNWGANKTKWNNWHWQLQNSIKSIEDLNCILSNSSENLISDKAIEAAKQFPLSITPYYFSLIKEYSYSDPIFSMSIPNEKELDNTCFLSNDPLSEEHDTVVDNLVHRYNDRALLISTSQCAVFCRHCTRKRVAGTKDFYLTDNQLDNIVNYIKNHPEIKDVIVSGGDPLTMSTSKLDNILSKLRCIDSLDIIRIGTRTPVTLPMRITDELVNMISQYHPIWINTHFNHPNEFSEESKMACSKIVNKGIPLGNQCVLLKGVNDNSNTMIDLCRGLLKMRVRPYYMYSCDKVIGTNHFQTSIKTGLDIMESLRKNVSGLGVPNFIVDLPDGKGKIPLLPEYIKMIDGENIIFSNLFNGTSKYINHID